MKADVSMRVGEGMRTLGAMKMLWIARSVNVRPKRELYDRVVIPTVIYGSEAWGLTAVERRKLDVMEMRGLRIMCEVTRMETEK